METLAALVKEEWLSQVDWVFWIGYFPLGVIGIWRWSVWVIKKCISFFYRHPKGDYQASLSVITPVYNEDPEMFLLALESWKANGPEEIIAVIDYTDKRCIEVFEKFSKNFSGAKMIVTEKPGKRAALADGINVATSEIVALVDSDTVWTEDIKKIFFSPFVDEKVGGVAPRQDVMGADTLAKKLFRIHIFNRYGNDLIFQAAFGDALSCISGRTGVYRRSAVAHLTEELENEKFLGKLCISGDDKRLTYLIQRDGWKVRYVRDALVYTPGFPDLKTYSKQQIRWTRNSWRADLTAIFSSWLWKHPFLSFHTIDRFFQPFTLLLGPMFFSLALYRGDWIIAGILVTWWLVSRAIKIAPHLIKHPSDVRILPAYVLFCYVIAVIKIYTLITVGEQSWITRWDKNRLSRVNYFKKLSSYAATAAIVVLLFFGVYEVNINRTGAQSFLEKAKTERLKQEKKWYRTEDESVLTDIQKAEDQEFFGLLDQKVNADRFGYYQVGFGETPASIRDRYLLSPAAKILSADKGRVLEEGAFIRYGEKVAIAVDDLRSPDVGFHRGKGSSRVFLSQDFTENAIRVKGRAAFITLPELARALNNKTLLENVGEKKWILRKNLFIDDGVTLIIDGEDVEWLLLKSEKDRFAWIKAEGGNLIISGTKITSWDETKKEHDTEVGDGRAYVLQKSNGRMDILNSEMAYLGYAGAPNRGNPYGGPYGVSWKIHNDTFRQELSTGNLIGSSIHHNFFGVYTFGVTGIRMSDNKVFENQEYGIDPHDDSNNLLIENNQVFRNGNHGIIASKRCFSNIIRDNFTMNNRLHGIMLDRDSNNNLVTGNYSFGNVNGMALYHSSENIIVGNVFMENRFGIRANNFSHDNYFGYNTIEGNKKGVFLYGESKDNHISANIFVRTDIRVHLKERSSNFLVREND